MRPLDEGHRLFVENVILAVVLPAVAGAVNASGFLAVGIYTSHVTGHVGRIGDELALKHPSVAGGTFLLVVCFFLGAVAATFFVERARRLARARYVLPLLVEAATLVVFASLATRWSRDGHTLRLASMLCFAMGMQNALVTTISGAVVRTTHLTGIVTDIGIGSVRMAGWVADHVRHSPMLRWGEVVPRFFADPEWQKLRLHLLIFVSFLLGAVIGPGLFLRFGQIAMAVPCTLLALLAAFDLVLGIRTHGERTSGERVAVQPASSQSG